MNKSAGWVEAIELAFQELTCRGPNALDNADQLLHLA